MYISNLSARWQMSFRSAFYILLIVSMLWIPLPADIAAARSSDEESTLTSVCEEERGETTCTDPDSDTEVIVPAQKGISDLEITVTPLDDEPIISHPDDEFIAQRGIAELSIVNSETGKTLTQFKPAIQIEVEYNQSDIEKAGGLENLTLGYFDGQKMRKFSNVEIKGDHRQGVISAEIDELLLYPPIKCPKGKHSELVDVDGNPHSDCAPDTDINEPDQRPHGSKRSKGTTGGIYLG